FANRNLRSMRWTSSQRSHSRACKWKVSASPRVSGGTPPRHGVHDLSAKASLIDDLAIKLKNEPPHTMRRGMLRPEVHGEISLCCLAHLGLACSFREPLRLRP